MLKNRSVLVFILLILGALLYLGLTLQLPPSPNPQHPGPALFPKIVIGGIFAGCAILIIRERTRKEANRTFSIDLRNSDIRKAVFLIILTVIYLLLLGLMNVYLLTVIFLVLGMHALKPGSFPLVMLRFDHWQMILINSVIVTAAIYLLFEKFLQIPLP